MTKVTLTPTVDQAERDRRLHRLLPPSFTAGPNLEYHIRKLDARFEIFLETAPIPLWAPGLMVTNEMHRQVEMYLPLKEIRASFAAAFRQASAPSTSGTALSTATSWYGFLAELDRNDCPANPAVLLRRFAGDYDFRVKFLFDLFLPRHFGGTFGRYPFQMREAIDFLRSRRKTNRTIRCLDAACGTGEQTWELADALSEEKELTFQVEGTSVDPLEVFAAAHAFFPHDPERERQYRQKITPIVQKATCRIDFNVENLFEPRALIPEYDVILCNGFLGGPFLHDPVALRHVIRSLSMRLRLGGLIFAADRFHDGWKKLFSTKKLGQMFVEAGLRLVAAGEGIAGEKVADSSGSDIVQRNNS